MAGWQSKNISPNTKFKLPMPLRILINAGEVYLSTFFVLRKVSFTVDVNVLIAGVTFIKVS